MTCYAHLGIKLFLHGKDAVQVRIAVGSDLKLLYIIHKM